MRRGRLHRRPYSSPTWQGRGEPASMADGFNGYRTVDALDRYSSSQLGRSGHGERRSSFLRQYDPENPASTESKNGSAAHDMHRDMHGQQAAAAQANAAVKRLPNGTARYSLRVGDVDVTGDLGMIVFPSSRASQRRSGRSSQPGQGLSGANGALDAGWASIDLMDSEGDGMGRGGPDENQNQNQNQSQNYQHASPAAVELSSKPFGPRSVERQALSGLHSSAQSGHDSLRATVGRWWSAWSVKWSLMQHGTCYRTDVCKMTQ